MPIKTSFFGYVREFDLNGEKITSDTAINCIKVKADDGYVTLIFRTIPERKVAEIGMSLEAWRLITKGVDLQLKSKEKNDVDN